MRVHPIAGGLALVLTAACASTAPTISREPSTTAAAAPAVASTGHLVSTWYTAHGTMFGTLTDDMTRISGQGASIDGMMIACRQLSNDVQDDLEVESIPEPDIAAHFRAALTSYRAAATDCLDGIATGDSSSIDRATSELTNGNGEIAKAAEAVVALSR